MAIQLLLAPAGQGKTAYVIERIQEIRADAPLAPIWVILPNQAQVSAFRRRLAHQPTHSPIYQSTNPGVLGVQPGTFYAFYAEILARAGRPIARLLQPVQHRLLRHVVDRLCDDGTLVHYAPLRDKPGFIRVLRELIEELKRARVHRDAFVSAVSGSEPRLRELSALYAAYQDWLVASDDWMDAEGQGWLAAIALEGDPTLAAELRLLVVDGFDEFNPTQLGVLRLLADRAAETLVTLTGDPATGSGTVPGRLAHRRFARVQADLVEALNVEPTPLDVSRFTLHASRAPLSHLESNLFEPAAPPQPADEAITFVEAQNRSEEVRAALRWLKARVVLDGMAPGDVALIARDLDPYRPFVEETAAELGLPVHIAGGAELVTNPAVAALIALLSLPVANWPRRAVLDAWRSPYFEGRGARGEGREARGEGRGASGEGRGANSESPMPNLQPPISNPQSPGHSLADRLDAAARAGLVIQGLEQWRAALDHLAAVEPRPEAPNERADDIAPPRTPQGAEAAALRRAFDAFVARLTPPPRASLRDYVAWVEDLIGDDPKLAPRFRSPEPAADGSLRVVANAWAVEDQPGGRAIAERDVAALRAFKDVLRGLVLAASALEETGPIAYPRFLGELRAAVEGATYQLPTPTHDALFVASLLSARGLSFRAVALLGLAEGDFPQAEREDTLLREGDRQALREWGLKIAPRLRGDEVTLFYEAVTRAREKLLLTRPYLADDGQPWEPSPYWGQVLRLFRLSKTLRLRKSPEAPPAPADVASPVEWIVAGVTHPAVAAQLSDEAGPLGRAWSVVQAGAAVLRARLGDGLPSPYEGDLSNLAGRLTADYGPEHVWSSSRLEAYATCPYHFFAGQALALEPRTPPQEGFDAFILGSIYHEILEKVYRRAPTDPAAVLAEVAAEVFDAAPGVYGFRPTALWEYQRQELTQVLEGTVVALVEASQGFTPYAQEQAFGIEDKPPLVIQDEAGDTLRVRGFIDRVDRATGGDELRIIDYKSGSTPIPARDLAQGKRVQLPLYALAARDALGLGQIAGGYYWHVGSGRPSYFWLEKVEGGVQGAIDTALAHAWATVRNVRAGAFAPQPPAGGCPGHCPAAAFCWRYVGRGW
jgi:ATP-dependent helicase/nuclease subunit B